MVVLEGLTVCEPFTDLFPDQEPDAVHVTGAVALEFVLQLNVVLCPAVIDVEEAEKERIGAIGAGAGAGVGLGVGDGDGDGVGVGVGEGLGVGVGEGVGVEPEPLPLPVDPLLGDEVPLVVPPADVPVEEPVA